jgi:phosphate transport system substrate-binding protein
LAASGSVEPLVRLLFERFHKQAPNSTLIHLSPPLGSDGAVKALATGRIDLAVIGRALHPEEATRVGKHFVLAETAFVLASRDGRQDRGFSLDQLAAVYEGQQQAWPDGSPIRLILRASFESDSALLRSMSPAMARSVAAAAQRPGMVTGDHDLDTLRLIARTSGSLGPTTLGLLNTENARLIVFPINGLTPSLAALQSGTYPWRKTITVVLPQHPSPTAEHFALFLRSTDAQKLLLAHDYLPVGK